MVLATMRALILAAIRVTKPQSRVRIAGVLLLGFALAVPSELAAQQPATTPASAPAPDAGPPVAPPVAAAVAASLPALPRTYPDSAGGLEHLFKDYIAARQNSPQLAEAYVRSLSLPHPDEFFRELFVDGAAATAAAAYDRDGNKALEAFSTVVGQALQEGFRDISVKKYTDACDDSAPPFIYPVLILRRSPIPMYEVRMAKVGSFRSFWALAYVDGGFRFLGMITAAAYPMNGERTSGPGAPIRIKTGVSVQAAKLIKKVTPEYPSEARREYAEGTVRIHAIIGRDGSVEHLQVVSGICSLSRSAVKAVRHWRYSPTLLNGKPVEVDTTIDVIYSLGR